MPSYHNPNQQEADRLNALASETFDMGTQARENADKYVRDTVLFASVLFLIALAQRLKVVQARIALGAVACGLLAFVIVSVVQLPRL